MHERHEIKITIIKYQLTIKNKSEELDTNYNNSKRKSQSAKLKNKSISPLNTLRRTAHKEHKAGAKRKSAVAEAKAVQH